MKTTQFLFLSLVFTTVFFSKSYGQVTQLTNTITSGSYLGTQNDYDVIFKRNNIFSGILGLNNTSFGKSAFSSNVSGIYNVAFGTDALSLNTSGQLNVAMGYQALKQNTTAGENVAVGSFAMNSNTTGNYNVSLGHSTIKLSTQGLHNVAIGTQALQNHLNPQYNIAIGSYSLEASAGSYNIGLGIHSGSNTVGSNNIAIGNTTAAYQGNRNILLGDNIRLSNKPTYPQYSFLDIGDVLFGTNMYNWDSTNGTTFKLGRIGVNVPNPNNTFEIKSENGGTSGLRFTNLNSSFVPTTTATKFLTVDANGDVILQNVSASGGSGSTTITAGQNIVVAGNPTAGYTISSPTTNTLVNDGGNKMTSTVNGVASTDKIVNKVINTITGGQLTTSVNGVSSSPVTLPSGQDTSIYNISASIVPADFGNRVVALNNNNLVFDTSGTNTTRNKVYIGSNLTGSPFPTTTGDYKLYVEGGVLTEKVKVALRSTANWADYVFAKDYKLMSLNEVETFVIRNKHLPGISSADKLVNEGLDLAEMQAKQMEKIEELTLYAIEQNKKIEKQEKEIEELKVLVKALVDKK